MTSFIFRLREGGERTHQGQRHSTPSFRKKKKPVANGNMMKKKRKPVAKGNMKMSGSSFLHTVVFLTYNFLKGYFYISSLISPSQHLNAWNRQQANAGDFSSADLSRCSQDSRDVFPYLTYSSFFWALIRTLIRVFS